MPRPRKKADVYFEQRTGVFVDVQNMFYSAKYKYRGKIDYQKLLVYIARGRKIVRALAYAVTTPEIDQSGFIKILEDLGIEVKIKELKLRPDGTAKGDWDMGIAIDSVALSDKLDVIALVSGDGDFSALVEMLKAKGVRVEVYSFPANTAEELKKVATQFYPLDESILFEG
ncbi:NYN domain-containing protein [bacterium]|nr:NYN domain-containing protein [bacterium]